MKGETINFRRKDGSWVSGFFLPDTSTQVSINSRKYYNYCRNDSTSVKDALAWDQCLDEDINYARYRNDYKMGEMSKTVGTDGRYFLEDRVHEEGDQRKLAASMTNRIQSSEDGGLQQQSGKIPLKKYVDIERDRTLDKSIGDTSAINVQKKQSKDQTNIVNNRVAKSKSMSLQTKQARAPPGDIQQKARQSRQEKLNRLTIKKEKSTQRLKIQEYVQSLVPYTRDLSNTRFKSYYGKSCMETYGMNNINEPIGGIIYGNHMKSFNIGPHIAGNDPKYYQSHTTTINFSKRTKYNEQEKWRRLEKQMGKKLGTKHQNHSVKQGKEINVQEVTEDNMYQIMKESHEFQKQHKDEIRALEKQYDREKAAVAKAQIEQYKQQRIADREAYKNTPLNQKGETTAADGMSVQQRMKNQTIYKMVDENGVARYSTDRHGLTCFVDLNFPENQQAYKQELVNRSPIYPIEVKEKDRHIDEIRKQNYIDSVVNCYPAHYLVPNVDYSQVKLISKDESKTRSKSKARVVQEENTSLTKGQNLGQRQIQLSGRSQNQSKDKRDEKINSQRQVQFRDEEDRNRQRSNNDNGNRSNRDNREQPQPIQYAKTARPAKQPQSTDYDSSCECHCATAQHGCAPDLKKTLLERAEKDPHLASKLLSFSKKYDCQLNNNQPTALIESDEYDPSNYYPHAIHELNPQMYNHVSPHKIPYAGLPSTKNKLE